MYGSQRGGENKYRICKTFSSSLLLLTFHLFRFFLAEDGNVWAIHHCWVHWKLMSDLLHFIKVEILGQLVSSFLWHDFQGREARQSEKNWHKWRRRGAQWPDHRKKLFWFFLCRVTPFGPKKAKQCLQAIEWHFAAKKFVFESCWGSTMDSEPWNMYGSWGSRDESIKTCQQKLQKILRPKYLY